mmetsp:Transcript_13805/g.13378  ORF Transcript_13805/g.13378 Transcript_13805/m.13378 type:complete len:524 (-) Transcript_13805:200-1771(-)
MADHNNAISNGSSACSSSSNDKKQHTKSKPTIIVVGGGLAGLSVSLALAKLGKYRVEIVERRHDIGQRKGGTYLMQPNAVRSLEQVCQEAMDPLYEMGVPIPNSECKMYAWWMVRDSLLQQVNKKDNDISLHMGWSFSALDDDNPDFIKARFTRTKKDHADDAANAADDDADNTQKEDNEDEDDVLELTGIMLVGSDGVHSAVRASLGLAPANATGSVCWRGSFSVIDSNNNNDNNNNTDENEKVVCNSNSNSSSNSQKVLAPLLTTPLLTMGKMVHGYIKCGPYCVIGLKSFHSKYPGIMTWTVNTREPGAAAKFIHPRDAVGAYLDSINNNKNDDDEDNDNDNDKDDNKKTAALIEAVFELADPEELHHSLPFVTIALPPPPKDVDENGTASGGWGGNGRVTLIGDAAHAMRSAGGQGGAMAFEDCVVLARILKQTTQAAQEFGGNDANNNNNTTATTTTNTTLPCIETAVLEFESSRLPRVRTIWNDQWERAERAYKGDFTSSRTVADELEYQAWVDKGV